MYYPRTYVCVYITIISRAHSFAEDLTVRSFSQLCLEKVLKFYYLSKSWTGQEESFARPILFAGISALTWKRKGGEGENKNPIILLAHTCRISVHVLLKDAAKRPVSFKSWFENWRRESNKEKGINI